MSQDKPDCLTTEPTIEVIRGIADVTFGIRNELPDFYKAAKELAEKVIAGRATALEAFKDEFYKDWTKDNFKTFLEILNARESGETIDPHKAD